jgi:hypothetical protein
MEAAVLIGAFLALAGFVWGGIATRKHIAENFDYNIFSLPNLFFGGVALISIAISIYVAADAKAFTTNSQVLLGFSGIVYLVMYIVNLRKSNWWLALISVIYQIVTSALIVFIILWIWAKFSKKR